MRALRHFLLLGAALFTLSRWTSLLPAVPTIRTRWNGVAAGAVSDERVLLGEAIARHLGDDDVVVQRRLVQNARAVGLALDADDRSSRTVVTRDLARGDPIVERRLVQQMRLELESDARRTEPTEAELRRYLTDHADRFLLPERIRVVQVFFSSARRGEHAERDARAGLDALSSAGRDRAAGDPSLWPDTLPLQTAAELEKVFGAATADVAAAPLQVWSGPYRSALGYHLVRVLERVPTAMPSFASVHTAVRLAWLNDRADQHVQQILGAVR